MPGMDGFDADAVVVQRNPMSGGATTAGERKGPAGVIPKVGGELQGAFEPFKPPETYEAAKVSADENDPETNVDADATARGDVVHAGEIYQTVAGEGDDADGHLRRDGHRTEGTGDVGGVVAVLRELEGRARFRQHKARVFPR